MGLYFWGIIVFENLTNKWIYNVLESNNVTVHTIGWKILQCLRVFVLVTIGFMFFRLQGVKMTLCTIKQGLVYNPWILFDDSLFCILSAKNIQVLIIGLIVMAIVSLYKRKGDVRKIISEQPIIIRWIIYISLWLIPLVFGMYGENYDVTAFIYERF